MRACGRACVRRLCVVRAEVGAKAIGSTGQYAAYWLWLVGWSRGRVVGLALVRCRGGGRLNLCNVEVVRVERVGEKEIGSSRVDRRSRREAAASGDRKNMKKLLPSAGLDRILNRKLDVVGRTKGAVDARIGSPGFPPDNKPVFDQNKPI